MKSLLLLGAASSFVFAFSPVVSAQTLPSVSSASVALTCRSALEGAAFSQVLDIASPPCCYVSLEEDWYKENGIRIASIYQRSNGDTYRAESCDLISEVGVPLDQTTTGGIVAGDGVPLGQPIVAAGQRPAASAGVQPSSGAGVVQGASNSGNAGGGNTGGSGAGQPSGANTGNSGNGNSDTDGDGNNGHGNDVGGVDPSNPGNSGGNHGNNPDDSGNGGEQEGRGRGNNGFGNGGRDGSPNGMRDDTR